MTMVSIQHRRSNAFIRKHILSLSIALNVILTIIVLVAVASPSDVFPASQQASFLRSSLPLKWNGGHPVASQTGTCYCSGADHYCMCTPSLAIDLVIASGTNHVWLVRRKDTGQLATMGGFVNVGETVEQAVQRELQEEMGIELTNPPQLLGVYSDPRRDSRRHTVSGVFAVHLDGHEKPVAADDIKEVQRIHIADIEKHSYFADHKTILLDYRTSLQEGMQTLGSTEGDFANDIQRSVCGAQGLPLRQITSK